MWPPTLSGRLPVTALVGHHPTNKLIGREPIPRRNTKNSESIPTSPCGPTGPPRISRPFKRLSRTEGQVTHVILTRSPLNPPPKKKTGPFDLHVLSTPPAFVLSQDQTLQTKPQPKSRSQTYGEQTPTHTQPPTKGGQAGNTQPPNHQINDRKEARQHPTPQQKEGQATRPTPSTTKNRQKRKPGTKQQATRKTSHPPTMNTKHDTLSRSQTTHPADARKAFQPSPLRQALSAILWETIRRSQPRDLGS